ncbi:MAG: hypothetical protein AAGK47_08560 [Bacteroidota bacterium]
MTATGTIIYNNIGMGFYGLRTDDGRQFQIMELAPAFAIDGLRVQVQLKTLDIETLEMWGTPAQILNIERI